MCHPKSYLSDIKYHMTLNIKYSVDSTYCKFTTSNILCVRLSQFKANSAILSPQLFYQSSLKST